MNLTPINPNLSIKFENLLKKNCITPEERKEYQRKALLDYHTQEGTESKNRASEAVEKKTTPTAHIDLLKIRL